MYAQLGNVQFALLPVTSLEERHSYAYAEHAVIEGKPLLQFVGDNLDELSIGVRFHFAFCDPESSFAALKAEADSHRALPFVFATGKVIGRYVVRDISKTTVQTADNGRPLNIEARLQLIEWVDTNPLGTRQAAQQKTAPGLAGKGPIGAVKPQDRGQAVIVAGQVKAGAVQIRRDAEKIGPLTAGLTGAFAAAAAQISAATAQIREAVAPIMATAQAVADDVQGAAAVLQGEIAVVSGLSSNIARITSGLPYPANLIGNRIAAVNRRISSAATDGITLASLLQGDAIETGTRARMITRMLPQ